MSRTRLVPLVTGVFALAILPILAEDLIARPRLPDSLLAATRGASFNFLSMAINDCSSIGGSLFFQDSPTYNGLVTVASCTGNTPATTPCGGCAVNVSSNYGVSGQRVPISVAGQTNQKGQDCGNLQIGNCGFIPVPPGQAGPAAPGCVNLMLYTSPAGNNIPCGTLAVIAPQAGGIIATQPTAAGR